MVRVYDMGVKLGLLRVVVGSDSVYILEKSSAYVYAEGGVIIVGDADREVNFPAPDLLLPEGNTVDEKVVGIRAMIDNT
jgi:hypothetical protein